METRAGFRLVRLKSDRLVEVPARGRQPGRPFTVDGFPSESWLRLYESVSRPHEVSLTTDGVASYLASKEDRMGSGEFEFESVPGVMPATPPIAFWHFHNGWWSVFERYWSLAEADSSLEGSLRDKDEIELRAATAQLPVRRLLFEFYTNATALIDNLGFMCYAFGALCLPGQFLLRDPKMLRRIDLTEASRRFSAAFPVEPMSRTLRGILASQELVELKAARNLWAHRGAPGFTTGRLGDTVQLAGFDWDTDEHLGHESHIRPVDTRLWRAWLGNVLAEVLEDSSRLWDVRSRVVPGSI